MDASDKTQEAEKLADLFKSFDVDSDGRLDLEELSKGLLSIGVLLNKRQVLRFS